MPQRVYRLGNQHVQYMYLTEILYHTMCLYGSIKFLMYHSDKVSEHSIVGRLLHGHLRFIH